MISHRMISMLAVVCSSFLSGTWAVGALTSEIRQLIPANYDIDSPGLKDAKQELERLVAKCGPGIVKGAVDESGASLPNRCSYQIALDDFFFKPIAEKTGLLHDRDWAFHDYVTFLEPNRTSVPDKFDIRDYMKNGQPAIGTQQCGDCWAWATRNSLELSRAVHDSQVFQLSVQTVLSCSGAGSCSGGTMDAVSFLAHGLPLESDFAYQGQDAQCQYSQDQINTGWDGKTPNAPYIGNSLQYSRALQKRDGSYDEGTTVQAATAAMVQWQAPLVVTVIAYDIQGSGVVDDCDSINADGNHMVDVIGWDMTSDGKRAAHVWNSWGTSHGDNGVSRIVWECGANQLNHGLAKQARILEYKMPCTPPNAGQIGMHEIKTGSSVPLGATQPDGTTCSWTPSTGLDNPSSCTPNANPTSTTEYHMTATNDCGSSSSMTLVDPWGWGGQHSGKILTPYGTIAR